MAPYERDAESGRLDMGDLISQVCMIYPGSFRGAETEAPLFFLLCRRMRKNLALQRVQLTNGVALGAGLVLAGDKVQHLAAKDVREAYASTG